MASVNKAIVVGNLGRDPEVRSFPDGGAVCNISIATTRRWRDKHPHIGRDKHSGYCVGRCLQAGCTGLLVGRVIQPLGRFRLFQKILPEKAQAAR